jgi:hypothetical protein
MPAAGLLSLRAHSSSGGDYAVCDHQAVLFDVIDLLGLIDLIAAPHGQSGSRRLIRFGRATPEAKP